MFIDVEAKIKRKNVILFSRDSICLQDLRKMIADQRHTTLVLWAFDCMQLPIKELMIKYNDEASIIGAYDASKLWAEGKVKMPIAKKAILECHGLAKRLDNTYDKALCHGIAQGCSTVHVETHALGLVFYELTAIVIKNNYKNYENEVLEKISFYEERLRYWEKHIEFVEKKRTWAEFLIRPNKVNKEKLLLVKAANKRETKL